MEASPDQALPAVQRISTTGRQALLEMRRLLGVLRDEPAEQPLEPQPSLARLDDLLAHVKAAGIPVSMEIDGDPQLLSEGVQLTIYRVAQEALTNTLKHANEPTHAHLVLRCGSGRVELELTDNGRELTGVTATPPSADAASVGGRGLRGMRERAAAYGGELEAGPCPGGGWLVRLQLDADVPPQT
jgi:signal transduction histidine kinase